MIINAVDHTALKAIYRTMLLPNFFHAILKKEEVYRKVYRDFYEAQKSLFKYIEGWYDNRRIHGSIFYMTPNEFEALAV